MTINKIGLSALSAVLLGTAAIAGTIGTTGASKIGKEALSLTDINVSNVTGQAKMTYTPKNIPAGSLKNPIFKFTFANAKSLVDNSTNGLGVFQVLDGNESNTTAANYLHVGTTATVTGSNNEVISFNASSASTYVYNDREYVIRDMNSTKDGVIATATDENLTATVVEDSTSAVTVSAALYSGDSQALNDSAAAATIYTIENEYSAAINTEFDARIDAASTFFKFYDQNSDGTTKQADRLQYTITKATGFITDGTLTGHTNRLLITPDQNLSGALGGTGSVATSATLTAGAWDNNISITGATYGTKEDVNLTVNGSTTLSKTLFGGAISIIKGTASFPLVTATTDNAGKWTIYGYYAQIPSVAVTANKETYMDFMNTSSLSANAIFTILPDTVDQSGNGTNTGTAACVVDAGTIASNQTRKFAMSSLLTAAAAQSSCTGFPTTGNFAVEVAIPTSPDDVYGSAVQKRTDVNLFKDLPVYNTSTIAQ